MKIGIDARLAFETGVGRYIRNLLLQLSHIDSHNSYVIFCREKDITEIKSSIRKEWKIVPTTTHWHSLKEQINFVSLLTKENIDLMHFPYFSLPILYKRPFVVTIHDLIIHHFPTGKASTLPPLLYYAKRFAFNRVLKHGIERSKKIIVPLYAVKDDIQATFGIDEDKIMVTYEGVDKNIEQTRQQRAKNEDQKYFLYVGNAYPHKNVEGLIKGFEEYKSRFTFDTKLYLVGKEDYFYKRLKKSLPSNIRKDIQFLHGVSDQELAELYKNAKGFVSASFMEGFGLPPLEALANNCVPMLSDIPSFREVCQENALYFDPRNPDSIASIMRQCYELSEKDKMQFLRKSLQRVEDFSWERMARETLSVYENTKI